MRFAIWMLVIAAGLSLVALLIGEMLPGSATDSALFKLFGLGDPFRSWWFRLLLGVLSLSLFVCVIERAPLLYKQAFLRTFRTDPRAMEGMPNYVKLILPDGEKAALALFHRFHVAVVRQESPTGTALSGVGGGLSRLGPLFNHFGMLLLILGGMTISATSSSERVTGQSGDLISQPEWGFKLHIDDFKIEYYPVKLNMWVEVEDGRRGRVDELRGDSARVVFAAHPGREDATWISTGRLKTDFLISGEGGALTPFQGNVKSYVTTVTVIEGDKEVSKQTIYVNHPLREKGFRFYQSSFQTAGSSATVDTVLLHCAGTGVEATVAVKVGGDRVRLPGGGMEVGISDFYPDFKLDENYKPFSASSDPINPAARVQLFKDGQILGTAWAFTGQTGHMGGGKLPLEFEIADLAGLHQKTGSFATVLEVNRDKGQPLVWAGFIIMTIGLMLVYMMSHRQTWAVVVKRDDGRDDVHLAGISGRDPEHFRQVWEEAVARTNKG